MNFIQMANIGEQFSTYIGVPLMGLGQWEVLEGPSISPKELGNLTSIGRQGLHHYNDVESNSSFQSVS